MAADRRPSSDPKVRVARYRGWESAGASAARSLSMLAASEHRVGYAVAGRRARRRRVFERLPGRDHSAAVLDALDDVRHDEGPRVARRLQEPPEHGHRPHGPFQVEQERLL